MLFRFIKNKIRSPEPSAFMHPLPASTESALNTHRTGRFRADVESTNAQGYAQQKRKKRAHGISPGVSQPNALPLAGPKPQKFKPSTSVQERHSLPWNDIAHMLGLESTTALSNSIAEMTKICQQNPLIADQLKPVIEQLEQARRTAMITLQFVRSRTAAEHETGYVSLREIAMEVLSQRSAWLKKRRIKVSVGPLDAKLVANITALFLLIDELVSWAGKLAPEIVIAINPSKLHRSGVQLLVYARFAKGHGLDSEWTNVGWYLWHKLAAAVGGSAELNVMDDALCVSVTFVPTESKQQTASAPKKTPTPTPNTSVNKPAKNKIVSAKEVAEKSVSYRLSGVDKQHQTSVRELSHDRDIAAIVQGCHVKLIMSDGFIKDQAVQAMASLRLRVTHSKSVQEALTETSDAQIPHAVVYNDNLNIGEVLELRCKWAQTRATAYIELIDTKASAEQVVDDTNFHFSSVGTMSTAHVTKHAIGDSLAPALLFELCKVL